MAYPYTLNTGKIGQFFEHVQGAGVPEKFNQGYLGATAFRSSNDRALVPLMKALRFIDSSGTPTERWKSYRNRDQASAVMAQAVRDAYAELFAMYPDAHRQSADTIRNFMASKSSVGERALGCMVTTFRSLCDLADFNKTEGESDEHAGNVVIQNGSGTTRTVRNRSVSHPDATVNVNINLTIEPTSDPDVYDAFFAAMRRHLI
ncbi:MAG: DUF5343 domain-containing protein, partial [Planctomycetota bacterium]